MRKLSLLFLTLFISLFSFGQYPDPTGYINDFANVIDESDENRLESKLSNYEDSTSIEITVVTINSLDGKPINDYAQELFTDWGIGKRETDAGLLILVAVDDREWRFHTGYGLEPYLTDATCRRIGDDNFPSHFREGDYTGGIEVGINEVIDELGYDSWELRKQYEAEQERESKEKAARVGYWFLNLFIGLLIFGLLILVIYISYKRRERRKKVKADIQKYKDKLVGTKSTIIEEIKKIAISKVINRKELLFELEKISFFNEDMLNIGNSEKDLIDIENEYTKYKGDFDKWRSLKRKNNRIETLYDDLKHHKRMLESRNDFLNRDNFINLLDKMITNSNITKEKGLLKTDSFKVYDLNETYSYLESQQEKYTELYEFNKEIIKKLSSVNYRRERVKIFKGVNKTHFLRMLNNIEEKFSCESVSKKELTNSLRYLDIKLDDFDRVFEINRGVVALRNRKSSLLGELMKTYLSIVRGYKRIKRNHPDILNKYLKDFKFEKKYYEERYMNNIDRLVDLSYSAILELDFKKADSLRIRCGETKTAFNENLKVLENLEKRIENAKRKIAEYENELTAKSGSLYNKTYKKVKDSDCSSSTVRKWNSLQTEIDKFHKSIKHFTDVILVSKHVKKLYDSLLSIKKRAERDIREAEEERRRKKREEERRRREEERRRRNSYSSSSSSGWGGGSSFGGGGSFGGFGGGSSGGGGASGRW